MEAYLRLLDAQLAAETTLVVIGGAAVALGWDSAHATRDVDLWNDPGAPFWAAVAALAHHPGAIPVQPAGGVTSPPINFEERVTPVPITGLTYLRVVVPEAHDLALMKVVRSAAHDLDAIEDIHQIRPMSLATLLERYHETRSQLIGREEAFLWNFLAMVARLFGEDCANELEASMGGA